MVILITRPKYDPGTNYLFYWSKFVISEAEKRGNKVLDLQEEKANKINLTSYIHKHKPQFIFFNGHGNKNLIMGQDNEVLVEANNNEVLLSESIVYARSCECAEGLGSKCVEKGTIAFLGYKKKYTIGYTSEKITRPLEDPVAKLFLEPSNLIPISLLKGKTVEQAHLKSQKMMSDNFLFMLSSKASAEQKDSAPFLWRNKKYQTVLGNKNARLV